MNTNFRMRKRRHTDKRKSALIEDEKDQIQKSQIFVSSCHSLIGPVSSRRLASLTIKILQFASHRLTRADFRQLCAALELLESDETWRCDNAKNGEKLNCSCAKTEGNERANEIAAQLAHACRLHPEMLGLLCSILPANISQARALRESNESLRAVREFCLCRAACGSDPCLLIQTKSTPGSSILKRAKLSNRPYLRTLLANLQSDTAPKGDLYPEIEMIDFEQWKKSKDKTFTELPTLS